MRMCFRKNDLEALLHRPNAGRNITRAKGGGYVLHLELTRTGANKRFDMTVASSRLCGATPDTKQTKLLVDWDFELRSVEAIYDYLGRIVRAQWTDPATFENAYQLPRDFGDPPFFLFKISEGFASGAVISANLG